jgi:predicted transcriptional regulator
MDALDHPNRAKLHAIILQDPGINFRQLARASGLAAGTARHHLTVLGRAGLVVEQGFGFTRRFFAPRAPSDAAVVLLRESSLKQLHDWIKANPGAPQLQVLDAMAPLGWSRSTTQHRLQRLVQGGALQLRCQGRFKRYWAGPAPSLLGPMQKRPTAHILDHLAKIPFHPSCSRRASTVPGGRAQAAPMDA